MKRKSAFTLLLYLVTTLNYFSVESSYSPKLGHFPEQDGGVKPHESILSRVARQTDPAYDDGGEYEYEEEETEERTTSTSSPPTLSPSQKESVEIPVKPDRGDDRRDEGKDEYDEEYEYEDENGRHEEEEREREEEERQEEETRREDERRQEESRVEADIKRKAELARHEEEARVEEEDRLEADRREQERLLAEQRLYEERRREEERRQDQGSEEDESLETTISPDIDEEPDEDSTTLPVPAVTMETVEIENHEEIDSESPTEIPIEETVEDENHEEIDSDSPTEIPIEETGRHDMERIEEETPAVPEKTEESYEYVESEETDHFTTTSTTTVEPPTENQLPEEESSTEEVEDVATDPSATSESPYEGTTVGLRPLQPFQSSSVAPGSDETDPNPGTDTDSTPPHATNPPETNQSEEEEDFEEHRDPNEYEVEPPASLENELEQPPVPESKPSSTPPPPPPAMTTTSPPSPQLPNTPRLTEREKYHHQDLELDEDDEDEPELYEGRRFSGEGRLNQDHRHGSDLRPSPLPPTHPITLERDDKYVTDLSQEPDEEDPEDDDDMTGTPPPTTLSPTSRPFIQSEEDDEIGDPHTARVDLPHVPVIPTESTTMPTTTTEELEPEVECFPGYELSSDGTQCLDVDECRLGFCGDRQICSNSPGSYRCSCSPGFVKDFRNEKLCRDLNECEIGNGGCSQDCTNTPGTFYCSCSDDHELGPNRRTCLRRHVATTTTTTTSTTTTTTTPPPTTVTVPTVEPGPILHVDHHEDSHSKNCPTPPVPRGAGIAYLYCSRSPVGIHHRHSQYERRLIEDWTARKARPDRNNLVGFGGERVSRQFRNRRNLRRRQRQTTYSPGSMCELRCRSGFELRGQYTLHCNATVGVWQGTTDGFCQALPKPVHTVPHVYLETTPSNEIPRVAQPQHGIDFFPTPPTFPQPLETTSFRPIFHHPRPRVESETRQPMTPPPPASRFSDSDDVARYWHKYNNGGKVTPTTSTRRPYQHQFEPVTFRPGKTPQLPTTTPSRHSFIQLSYRFKTPWITCPDDIRIDLQPNTNLAYVIIPQPQTNVDWWRQVTAEPSWAKGLETELGPGKQRITFRARTSAPYNNTAECAFTLEIRDMDPPRVRECPESLTLRLNPGQSARPVTWLEPNFSDNVRITSTKKSHDPGTILTLGEHLVNYEARDPSGNVARCSFTITVLPSLPYNGNGYGNTHLRKPLSEGVTVTSPTTTTTSPRPEVHSAMRNVVCYVGKKGRRIVFLSRVIPRGCSEMSLDMTGEQTAPGSYNTLNTISENSAENMATSQISSVSYTSHDTPQSASAFGQALSNGRNTNRMVHSTSSVTNGAHGTNSKSSSYAIAVSSSSRNFEIPFLTDKQVYEEEDHDQIQPNLPATTPLRTGYNEKVQQRHGGGGVGGRGRNGTRRQRPLGSVDLREGGTGQRPTSSPGESKKYFRHFNSWGTNGLLRGD